MRPSAPHALTTRAKISATFSCRSALFDRMSLSRYSLDVSPRFSLRRLACPALPRLADLRQHRRQKFPRITARRLGDVFRWAPGDDLAAAVAAFGAEID